MVVGAKLIFNILHGRRADIKNSFRNQRCRIKTAVQTYLYQIVITIFREMRLKLSLREPWGVFLIRICIKFVKTVAKITIAYLFLEFLAKQRIDFQSVSKLFLVHIKDLVGSLLFSNLVEVEHLFFLPVLHLDRRTYRQAFKKITCMSLRI